MFERLKKIITLFKQELKVYQLVLQDSRTPKAVKWLLGFAVAYIVSPIDIIPDFIPVLGHLDDAIIVPLLIIVALKLIPKVVLEDARIKAFEK